MLLKAPKNFGGMSIEGNPIKVDERGQVEVSPHTATILRSHGFTEVRAQEQPPAQNNGGQGKAK